ncbi:polysaccharide deacetylase family protein [Shewanella sp. NIFS-20-20]|uniref:polysaccharide deacetylase family protein n=1 Tax=Shewanella sp. NIFS-20-20 TaxID=2853806 RepID=UPI001C45BE29|nr:polysaccharide deacetylase family protein [Shewanella sp. NIFS-20-20]MBV7316946.1 polysaccharide deacetylase family protein [Shewanella sp. NIFS-20-20]
MFKNWLSPLLSALCVLAAFDLWANESHTIPPEQRGAVILQYHHVSDTGPRSTSVTPAEFRQQMQYLKDNGFTVIQLSALVDAIRQQTPLANKSVVITFDDGYQDIAANAHPILAEFGFPYTLFVAIEPIEKGYRNMMDWATLAALAKEGAEIANHSYGHEYLVRMSAGETATQWLARVSDNIERTEATILAHTGQSHKTLAYPYGEYNADLQEWLAQQGYIALGQQSGAAGWSSGLTALPRFPVAGPYADMSSLSVKMHSLNMPVEQQNIHDPLLKDGQWRPQLQITLDMTDIHRHQMMCFIQGQGAKAPQWISENSFTIQAELDLPPGRSRYNCTAPSKATGRYYWFSQAWVRPRDDGSWPTH